MRHRRWIPAGFLAFALLLAACGSQSSGSAAGGSTTPAATSSATGQASPGASSQPAVLKTAKTSLGTVLTNSRGYTVYWFAIDTPSTSKCTGTCVGIWPFVSGTPQAAPGVTLSGKLGTINRSDGTVQATYNGHPLYTFSGDTGPGETKGNLIKSFGGTWHALVISGATGASPSPSASSGGYGY